MGSGGWEGATPCESAGRESRRCCKCRAPWRSTATALSIGRHPVSPYVWHCMDVQAMPLAPFPGAGVCERARAGKSRLKPSHALVGCRYSSSRCVLEARARALTVAQGDRGQEGYVEIRLGTWTAGGLPNRRTDRRAGLAVLRRALVGAATRRPLTGASIAGQNIGQRFASS